MSTQTIEIDREDLAAGKQTFLVEGRVDHVTVRIDGKSYEIPIPPRDDDERETTIVVSADE